MTEPHNIYYDYAGEGLKIRPPIDDRNRHQQRKIRDRISAKITSRFTNRYLKNCSGEHLGVAEIPTEVEMRYGRKRISFDFASPPLP